MIQKGKEYFWSNDFKLNTNGIIFMQLYTVIDGLLYIEHPPWFPTASISVPASPSVQDPKAA